MLVRVPAEVRKRPFVGITELVERFAAIDAVEAPPAEAERQDEHVSHHQDTAEGRRRLAPVDLGLLIMGSFP